MGDALRVLARSDGLVPASRLERRLQRDGLPARIEKRDGAPTSWTRLLLRHRKGSEIALIERKPVEDDDLGAEELERLRDELRRFKPDPAARWLEEYLDQVQCLYVFQLLGGVGEEGGWDAVHAVQWEIWMTLGGILQADGEGFSNEDGSHILWQFPEDVAGTLSMAVLDPANRWVPFEMDLGDPDHRRAFLAGQVPEGARRL
jgi:hypothetical protein